jgi:hypothetical protein
VNANDALVPAGPWLNGRRWDLTWLMGTALIIPLTLLLVWGGISSDALNLLVTLLAGGPHVFATLLTTYMDPRYRRRHPWALAIIAVMVPGIVMLLTVFKFQFLMSFFIFAASFHVLQQNAYLSDAYRLRSGKREPWVSRVLDYAVLFLSFYPIASYKLVHNDFMLGEIRIVIPDLAKTEFTYKAVSTLFAVSVVAWSVKSAREWSRGVLNVPKTALILLTATIAFIIPATAGGERLELAFQSVNAWHSLQYLSIVWLVLDARRRRGPGLSKLLRGISGSGAAAWRFYGLCILFTMVLLGGIVLIKKMDPLSLTAPQYYYMSVFSVLFIHYAFDGYFFLMARRPGVDPADVPLAVAVQNDLSSGSGPGAGWR